MMCLVGPAGKRSGEVVRVDFSCPPDLTQHRTANSFTDLLIGMGRILEIRLTGRAGPGAIEQAMIALGSLNLDTEQLEDWRWFAEEQLGDG